MYPARPWAPLTSLPRDLVIRPQTQPASQPVCPGLLWLDSHHFIAQAGPVTAPPHGPAGLVRRINRVGQVDMFIPTVMCILESDWDQVTSYTRPVAGW